MGRYEEALEIAEEIYPLAYRVSKLSSVGDLLYEIAWNTEQIMKQKQIDMTAVRERGMPLFYQVYLIAVTWREDVYAGFIEGGCG